MAPPTPPSPPSPSPPPGRMAGLHPLRMIDVGDKPVTARTARASAVLRARAETVRRLFAGELEKGDALAAARLAGIMAAKRTGDLIPLCHPLPLDAVDVAITRAGDESVAITAAVRTTARTGVEMEALVAATTAALTIYDMCKSIDQGLAIEQVRLDEKTGGTSGDYRAGPAAPRG